MLPRADLNSTRPAAAIEAPTPVASGTDARQEVYHRLTQIAIGKQLHAEVLSLLKDGTFLVRVADATARMALPVGTRVGDSVPMTLVAREPRPTFLLGMQPGSAPASLSAAGRLIDSILQAAQQDGEPAAVVGRTPLTGSSGAVDTKQIAASLRNALASSGLFYESHVHQWINGDHTLTDLMREPQAQIGQPVSRSDVAKAELAQFLDNMRDLGNGSRALVDLIREAQTKIGNAATLDAYTISQQETNNTQINAESARLISLQLDTLEHRHVRWQGELWPGQTMEWEVSEDAPESQSEEAPQSSWKSVVRFELPTLGEISATVHLVGERVHVQVNTATEAAASSLRAHRSELADALDAAGSPLSSLTVKNDEPA